MSLKLKDYITVTEAANERRLTRQAILARIKRGKLPATRVGNQWLIKRSDLAIIEPKIARGAANKKTARI